MISLTCGLSRTVVAVYQSFLATYVASEYELDRRIDEVEVEDTFPMVGRNTAASTVADILKTKQAVLVDETDKAAGTITRHDTVQILFEDISMAIFTYPIAFPIAG